jgi:dienelactone hydrolase
MDKVKNFFKKVWSGFKVAAKWAFSTKSKGAFIIGLALVLFGGLFASAVQTDWYSVSIYSKTIEVDISKTADATAGAIGKAEETGVMTWSTADIYKPKSASADAPVPLVLVAPGIQRTKETQASFCIELSRRGFGVICLDPYGQGESSPSYESQSATREGYGLFHWMDYLYTEEGLDEFSWVDYTRIGATGHSAGGNGVQKLAEREGKIASENKSASRINAVYITGYIRGWSWSSTSCNIGISYSKNDEGAFQNKTAIKKNEIKDKKANGGILTADEEFWLTVGNADMRYAPEALDIVNYQLNRAGQPTVEEVEVSADYGNPYEGTYVVINNESCIHALQPYDGDTLTNLVRYFGYVFDNYDAYGMQNGYADNEQTWLVKEIFSGLALCGGFTTVLALFCLLLETKLFKSMKKEIPARTGDQKVKGRVIFWISFVISAVIACLLYVKCAVMSVEWFPEASNGTQTWFFPQRFTNAVMMWAVFNGLIGVVIFFLTWGIEYVIDYVRAKKGAIEDVQAVHSSYKEKLTPLKMQGSDFWKTPLLALILIVTFFALNWFIYLIFHVDMRFFVLSARVMMKWESILAALMYVPFFFIFYMSNSLRVNCGMRPSNWPEWLSKLISVLGNTVGLLGIMFIQYIPFVTSGTIGYTGTVGPEWLFVNMLLSIIPMMAALPLFNRFFFNKSGRAWVGAIVICVIFILMTASGTTIYYAL